MSQQTVHRLARSAEAVMMAQEQLEDERRRRNEIVLDARREGLSYGEIARAARLTRARVMHIIAENAGALV